MKPAAALPVPEMASFRPGRNWLSASGALTRMVETRASTARVQQPEACARTFTSIFSQVDAFGSKINHAIDLFQMGKSRNEVDPYVLTAGIGLNI